MGLGHKKAKTYGNGRAMGDIQAEKPNELQIAQFICEANGFERIEMAPDEYFPFHDFTLFKGEKAITYELKRQEIDSGNVFVELKNSKTQLPTCINLTRADKWVEFIQPRNLILSTTPAKLKALIAAHPELRVVKKAGDGSEGVLIPISLFIKELQPKIAPFQLN